MARIFFCSSSARFCCSGSGCTNCFSTFKCSVGNFPGRTVTGILHKTVFPAASGQEIFQEYFPGAFSRSTPVKPCSVPALSPSVQRGTGLPSHSPVIPILVFAPVTAAIRSVPWLVTPALRLSETPSSQFLRICARTAWAHNKQSPEIAATGHPRYLNFHSVNRGLLLSDVPV